MSKSVITFKLLSALLILMFTSCKKTPFSGLEEGSVIYDLQLDGDAGNAMMKAMMPSEAELYFAGDKTCTVLSGPMGAFEARIISDSDSKLYANLFEFFGRKIAVTPNVDSLVAANNNKYKVEYTGNTKEIAGVPCEEATITGENGDVSVVFFTKELGVKNPNWATRYRAIDGLLMEYSLNLNGMQLKLTAKEIKDKKHDASVFQIPDGFQVMRTDELKNMSR